MQKRSSEVGRTLHKRQIMITITNFEQKLIICIHVQWLLLYQYINHITVIYNLTFIPLIFPFISIHSKFIVDVHPINKIIFSIHFVITALMYVSNKQLLSVLNVKNFLYHLKGHKKSCFIILMLKIKKYWKYWNKLLCVQIFILLLFSANFAKIYIISCKRK